MEEIKELNTVEEIKVLSDPFRYKILNCFYKFGVPATVKQVADDLGEVPAKVHYHVKKMEKADILILTHTKEVNGIVAKYYEPTAKRFEIKDQGYYDSINANKKLIMTESQKMLSELYSSGRDTFIRKVSENITANEKGFASINMQEIYLTEEEARKFEKYIRDYIEEHSKLTAGDPKKKFHCFFSIVND